VGWFLGQIPGTNGFQNFPLAERWNGSTWTVPPAPAPKSLFGATLAEQWNGTGWRVLPSPNPAGAGVAGLGAIACPAAAACMAVGSSTDQTGESAFNLAESWNGTSRSLVKTPNPGSSTNELRGVSCAGPSSRMAVGDFAGIGNELTLAEARNGTSWSVVKTPRP
jgi:hypothetical protein